MIAVSSFKPFSKSPAIAVNQLQAKHSWEQVFDKIVYLCPEPEPRLSSSITTFVQSEEFPTIHAIVSECAKQDDWACIINSDIIVSFRLKFAERDLKRAKAMSAISLRWQIPENKIMDQGLDFFAAQPCLWELVRGKIPKSFRIGHPLWDTWMVAFFGSSGYWGCQGDCYDLTYSYIIYHPTHQERNHEYRIAQPNDGVLKRFKWPSKGIRYPALARL